MPGRGRTGRSCCGTPPTSAVNARQRGEPVDVYSGRRRPARRQYPPAASTQVPSRSIRSGAMSRIVWEDSATRPVDARALSAASRSRHCGPAGRPPRKPSSTARCRSGLPGPPSPTALSTAVAMKPPWCIMIDIVGQAVGGHLHRAVLGVQRFAQHRPAAVDLTEAVAVVDTDVAVVDDVGAVAVDGPDALDLDARRVQRHQEHGEALVFRRIRVGVGDQEDVLAVMRAGGEHLETVDSPALAVTHGAGLLVAMSRPPSGSSVARAQADEPGDTPGSTSSFNSGDPKLATDRTTIAVVPVTRARGRGLLQFPDTPPNTGEPAVGGELHSIFRAPGARCQMHALVEVVPGLAVVADDTSSVTWDPRRIRAPRAERPGRRRTVRRVKSPRRCLLRGCLAG